ncbi:MAG TPA: pilus assembly protein TadG-related protein [Actinomycetes bacterium]|jgi:Flp pilus assembly protein TadG|nr:pilus assembly protein TadG-related protein [Actinomycetes bacterium]
MEPDRAQMRTRPPEREGGAVAVSVAVLAAALLLVVGLVFEGGVAIAAKRRALNVAEQAARAGAEQLDLAALRVSGRFTLDAAKATAAANAYLADAGSSGLAAVDGDTVTVSGVPWSSPAPVLHTIGISFSGTVPPVRARNLHGIVVEEP